MTRVLHIPVVVALAASLRFAGIAQTSSVPLFTPETAIANPQTTDADREQTTNSRSSPDLFNTNQMPLASSALTQERTSFSASEIIDILQNNSDLLSQLKDQAADYLTQKGVATNANDITDQQLFDQIQSNEQLRSLLTTFLIARGYTLDNARTAVNQFESIPAPLPAPACKPSRTILDSSQSNQPYISPENCAPFPTQNIARIPQQTPNPAKTSPGVLHQPAPYNLRALHDLYTQLPEPSESLHRFGSDLFTHPEANASSRAFADNVTPLDVPLGPDYVLGPGDTLNITIWGNISQTVARTVDREGAITLPEGGRLLLSGMTFDKAQAAIEASLKPQYRNSHISVTVSRLHSVRVYITGDVQRPGGYDIGALATPISALFLAGGPTAVGSLRVIRHMRGQQIEETIDLYEFLLHGVHSSAIHFQSGDTLLVPPAGPQVAIAGAVRRPAIYELLPKQTALADVLAYAGGPGAAAALDHITIERINSRHERETITLPSATDHELRSFNMLDGDRVRVSPILPYSQKVIYLQGHVVRPGRFPFTDGMKLSDVLQSNRDMLPEPAAHGEIVRLVPPDLHAETIDFNVPDVMIGNNNHALQPFDTIRIFGRYDIDSPKVTIQGEVLRPGVYPLSGGMTAAGLVRMAGGFNRDALRSSADLTSYDVRDGSLVVENVQSVRIGAALDNSDRAADIMLKPGDVLSIHQITGWSDIGQSVTINGQVRFPGSYGFRDGERLSAILLRAGGFRDSAYPEGAVLVRDQVRELEEKSRDELIRQIETTGASAHLSPALASSSESNQTLQLIKSQQQDVLNQLKNHPPTGRLVIHISAAVNSWANTPADIELRRGDILTIPKRPGFVLISGQVYNPTALTFTPDKSAAWYLARAGGTNTTANRKEIFIIRANGSVIGHRSRGLFSSDALSTKLYPGDVIVVPQKILGNSLLWRNLMTTAQLVSSIAITAAIAAL